GTSPIAPGPFGEAQRGGAAHKRAGLGGRWGLVEVVAGHNDGLGEATSIEDLSGFDAQPRQVTGIKPNAGEFMPAFAQPLADLHRMADAFQSVVSVHEKNAIVGHGLGINLECLPLVVEGHYPTMGMGPP